MNDNVLEFNQACRHLKGDAIKSGEKIQVEFTKLLTNFTIFCLRVWWL